MRLCPPRMILCQLLNRETIQLYHKHQYLLIIRNNLRVPEHCGVVESVAYMNFRWTIIPLWTN